jgi:hypothetical protein
MSRPRFIPTEEQRRTVKSLSAYGIKQDEIAQMLGLRSPKSLRKHFRQEINRGGIEATAQVGQTLYQMATSGKHPAATIFWLKTRAGWREIQIVETRPAAIPDFIVEVEKEAA